MTNLTPRESYALKTKAYNDQKQREMFHAYAEKYIRTRKDRKDKVKLPRRYRRPLTVDIPNREPNAVQVKNLNPAKKLSRRDKWRADVSLRREMRTAHNIPNPYRCPP